MKPKTIQVIVEFEIDMDGWDTDIDWSNPKEVILEQMKNTGPYNFLREETSQLIVKEIKTQS